MPNRLARLIGLRRLPPLVDCAGVVCLLVLSASCTSAPALDDVLSTSGGDPTAMIDDEVRRLTDRADEAVQDAAAQLAAAQGLAAAIDMRLVHGQWRAAYTAGLHRLSVSDLVGLDDALDSDLRSDILGLAMAGMRYARSAEALGGLNEEAAAEASYYHGFHLTLVAWGEGTTTAVLRGRGPALAKLLKELVDSDPLIVHAGPLRLRGRFLDRAPWPYKDRDASIALLRRASAEARVPVNFQFLGDALWMAGLRSGAVDAWRAGIEAGKRINLELDAKDAAALQPWEPTRLLLLDARVTAAEREPRRRP